MACEVGPACWVGGKVAGRRVSQVWVTARAQEQRDGSPQLLGERGQLGCSTEHRPRIVIRQSGWEEHLGFGLSSTPLSLGWFYHLLGPWFPCQ